MPARVLLVEDEPDIRDSLARALKEAGFATEALSDGDTLEEVVDTFRPDLVLLDILLPGRDGVALAAVVRARGDAGVLMLTARDAVSDRVRGLRAGADDYVVKPFAMEEVIERVKAILRRRGRLPDVVEVADLVFDEGAGVVLRAGHRVDLTRTEWRMLAYLVGHRGRTLSKTQVLTQVWGYEDYDPNVVEVHMSALRRKLEEHGPRLIHTVRGLGYVLRA